MKKIQVKIIDSKTKEFDLYLNIDKLYEFFKRIRIMDNFFPKFILNELGVLMNELLKLIDINVGYLDMHMKPKNE